MKEKMKLNKQGYEEYLQAIEKKEKKLASIRMYKGTDAIYQGDNWHDNPTLYQTEAQELALMRELAEMKFKLQNAEILENLDDDGLVDIGDVVKIDIIFSESDREEMIFRLVATAHSFNMDDEIKNVSINSPIGSAMYQKRIGDIAIYEVGEQVFTIEIKEKMSLSLEENDIHSRKTR